MIEITDLTVQFGGVRPIDSLTVTFDSPIHGLIGPNGAGKTTLVDVLNGFVAPTAGSVQLFGEEILGLRPEVRARAGLRRTFQTEQMAPDLTLTQNVAITFDNSNSRTSSSMDAASELLTELGLEETGHPAGALSLFERRIGEICRAVAGDARVVLMDEPGAGLSGTEIDELRDLITRLAEDTGVQIIIIDHDLDLITRLCEQIAVLDFGQLVANGPTADVLADPAVQAAYVGETPQ